MTHIEASIHIAAPREQVWRILADFGGVAAYHPGLRRAYSTSAANEGVGATRHCELRPFGSIDERIVDWVEGREYLVEIVGGERIPPFETALARLQVVDDGHGSRVTMSVDYRLEYGPVGALLDALVVRRQFAGVPALVLRGLKIYAETGERPTRARIEALAPAVIGA